MPKQSQFKPRTWGGKKQPIHSAPRPRTKIG